MPQKSRKRSRSRSSEISGISGILKRIENRLDNVEKKQLKLYKNRRNGRMRYRSPLFSDSSSSGESEVGCKKRRRDAQPSTSRDSESLSPRQTAILSSEEDERARPEITNNANSNIEEISNSLESK